MSEVARRPFLDRISWIRNYGATLGAISFALVAGPVSYQINSEPAATATKVYVDCPVGTNAVAFNGIPDDDRELLSCVDNGFERPSEPIYVNAEQFVMAKSSDPNVEPQIFVGAASTADFIAWCYQDGGQQPPVPAIYGDTLVDEDPLRNVIDCADGRLEVKENPNRIMLS